MVALYRVLYRAEQALTVPQIADRFPPGFMSAAMGAYIEHKKQTDPAWLKGKGERWDAPDQHEALIWWLRKLVQRQRETRHLKVVSAGAGNSHGIREGTYTANLDYPPSILVPRMVQEWHLEPWSPENYDAITMKHVAAMEFSHELRMYRARGGKASAKDLQKLVDIAERAIG